MTMRTVESRNRTNVMRNALSCMTGFTLVVALSVPLVGQGILVGPRSNPPGPANVEQHENKGFLKDRMNIPSMRLAIPVLDPGIPESTKVQSEQGIWPELRKSESVWTALKLKEWIHRYNQFDSIVVSADSSVSADVYFLGEIKQSDGETLRISYQVVDATGQVWLKKTKKYLVEEGWHQRNRGRDVDPFDPFYHQIADDVYEALKDRGMDHAEEIERHTSRRSSKQRPLTDLERITLTRKLAFARFLSPEEFGETLKIEDGRYHIEYLPQTDGADWARVESIQRREDDFATTIEKYYTQFGETIKEEYTQWQTDTYPVAREVRLAKRARTVSAVVGTILLAASAASATDGAAADGDGSAQLATKAGAAIGAGMIAKSFFDNARRKDAVATINEMGESLHSSLKPTRIDLNGKVVTLAGTAQDQFVQWRNLLTEMYTTTKQDGESVQILESQ